MKFLFESDTWKEVYDSLTKNKVRTVITMIGVWWGILLLIALLGAARGMENSFNRIFGDFATNSVFIWGQNTSIPFKGFQEGKLVSLKLSHVHKIKENIEGVELVVPRSRSQALVFRNFLSGRYGVNGDYPLLDQIQKKKMLRGRFINQNDINSKRKSAVISEDVYKQLFDKNENPIGRYIQVNSMNFTVIGVFQNENVDMGPSSDIHIPFTTFQQIYNRGDRIGWMVVTGKPDYNIKQIEEDIKLFLRNLNKIHPRDKRALGSFNLGKEFAKITGFLKGMQFLTWFVGIATLIAGVFAIGNILLITVKERTKEIGIRRALGATPFEIKRQIVVEAVFLTLLSGILGIITGGWILIVIDKVWGQGDDATLVNASVSIAVVFVALALLVLLGSLIGLIPAFKATRLKPIEALREE